MNHRMPAVSQFVRKHFGDEIAFLKGWIGSPKVVGSVTPTSTFGARTMASVVNPASALPVLELGPGTGVITKAILARGLAPQSLYCVEYAPQFVALLRQRYPQIHVLQGDAFDLDAALGERRGLVFDTIVCSLPLMTFPMHKRRALIRDLLGRLVPGRPIILYTYAMLPPVRRERGDDFVVQHHELVVRNVPPANFWIYRREGTARNG
jgi:phosphatidylethanolamine/phosphatidyl-N-methylethanolamine N-methyltransferase